MIGELFQGFTLKKLNDDFYQYIKNIYSFFVADKIRLGTVFVQHKKKV